MSDSASIAGSSVASSVSSGHVPPGSAGGVIQQGLGTNGRLLLLSLRGEWGTAETLLRNAEKGDPEINRQDEETGVTPFMLAVKDNKIVVAERLIDLGVHINARAKDGRSAIHYAAASAKDEITKLLISKRADTTLVGGPASQLALHMAASRTSGGLLQVQQLLKTSGKDSRLAKDANGCIPLFLAVESGNISVARELLTHQREEQLRTVKADTGDTPLHAACRRKDPDLIKLLVECGGSVNVQNDEGHSPLHIAAWVGDETTMKYFYLAKADANILDKLDRSPVHIAAENGHTNIVELLVDKFKANVSARTKDGSTLMHVASQCGHPETALMFLKKGVPLHMPNKAGAVCLHAAAKRGHMAVVKALLQKGALVDAKTKDSYTALHIAVQHCKPLVVQTLLGHGAQVQLKGGKAEETPLHIAARIKEGEKVAEMLLKSGADVNAAMANGETAMHTAARHGHLLMVQALLEEGGDPVCQSKSGENPLHIAVRRSHYPIVKEIIQFLHNEMSRLDAVMAVNEQSTEGETPLHYAAEITKEMIHYSGEDTDIMQLLLQYDADINLITKLTQESSLHYCARAGNNNIMLKMVNHLGPNRTQLAVNRQSKNGWSPLLVASEEGHVEIVKLLLQSNARVDVFDEHGKAALHLAAENGHREVADILLWHKAFVNAKSKLGITPLHLGAQNGHNELVKLLICTHSATIDALSLAKKTPLHLAAQSGQLEVCETLLKLKSDPNSSDMHGQTPLHLAAKNDHAEIVKLFLKHKPELVTMANSDGSTCGHIAASKGSVAVIKELLRFNKIGVCTAKNKTNDSTALHLAAAGGHKDVVSVLIDNGASPTEENADGMTAIHLAAKNGHVGVLESLKGKVSWKAPSVKTGLTALHIAAHYGQSDFVREMLTKVPATIRSESPASMPGDLKEISIHDHGLTPLHLAAQSGHEGLVRLLLNSPGVQPDVPTQEQGTIPLHLASQSGHTAVVGLLLSKSTTQLHVKDKRGRTGLHLAAANGHYDMASLLLGQGSDINAFDKNGWTPLHFAAKAGFLNVVTHLVESGGSPKFETKDGRVAICYAAAANHLAVLSYLMKKEHNTQHLMEDRKFVFDLMVCGRYNNNESIQEFILRSPAPINTAAKLSKNFRQQSAREKERARDLTEASAFCECMAVDLLSVSASTSSAGHLLRSVDSRGITFLDVLIECEDKEVVAHPSVQRYLSDLWMGNLTWASWQILLLFLVFIILPPIWVFFSLPLKLRFNKLPIIKFMGYLVSHIYLIILLILTTVITPFIEEFIRTKSLVPNWYEWLLLVWLTGLLVSEITNPGDRQGLGYIRVVTLAFSSVACIIHIAAIPFSDDTKLYMIYARNQFFAWCLLFTFAGLLEFLSFHHLFGPWAIIIRDLMKDLVRFMVILLIFLVGFMLHLSAVYQPVTEQTPEMANSTDSIQTPIDTFVVLFFSLFGLVEPGDLPPTIRSPPFTTVLVKFVFGTYLIVTLIVLINLLIAMMSDTYQRIQAQSDTEWKFGRAKLIRQMNKSSATPAPLNILTKLVTYCKAAYKHKCKVCSAQARDYINENEEMDAISDARSIDIFGHHTHWLRNVVRRNTQVAPDGGFLRAGNGNGPTRIEEVLDWDKVVRRYLVIKGLEEDPKLKEEPGLDDESRTGNANNTAVNKADGTKNANHVV
ncbi:serine/threonine-protein phosphatase 6 regulatory ankyrin repeat subunit B-like isoform X2 [Acanthaster planci]|uniref:Serine/threonine-protein phosphatase 6 regulatory ankyrin repeat subunit B-like isoform X2 n=1 Tax=Acanthaster planci TaxID=133434 RepID=A0A8B7YAF9_ACAPL|nr:serine/threonine-protein phosphatase 6 regulatory ankyrin repeat subunit B-like isoform X2 [Acanthaster planci]